MNYFRLLYEKYVEMMSKYTQDEMMDECSFAKWAEESMDGMHLVEVQRKGEPAFLYYGRWQEDDVKHFIVLPFGYYAKSEKMMARLFQKFAEEVVDAGTHEFSINVYADDEECLRALHMMQFGNMSEKGILKLEDSYKPIDNMEIRVISKDEIKDNWAEIWKATKNIVDHLKTSPIFYPGEEFTEEVYSEYFLGDDLELIGAFDGGKLAGIIEWNEEANEFLEGKESSVNVGEAYVYPEYRGTGLAEGLLKYAEKRALEAGYSYMWVEHGTANPNARGFWNKYFKTYQYELIRNISVNEDMLV